MVLRRGLRARPFAIGGALLRYGAMKALSCSTIVARGADFHRNASRAAPRLPLGKERPGFGLVGYHIVPNRPLHENMFRLPAGTVPALQKFCSTTRTEVPYHQVLIRVTFAVGHPWQ